MPFIAVLALHLLLVPITYMEGPILLLPMIRRVRRRYTLPPRYRHHNKQDPAPHNYRVWRPCMLLLYIACFFDTPTAPSTGIPARYYHAPVPSTTVISPHNTRYNNKWVLQCGDVHPNPGHRRIYQLRRDCRHVPRPPVPLLDIEEYAQHLVVNTNRQHDGLDNVTNTQDRDMKLATWNIQGAQGSVTLQRWANVLHLMQRWANVVSTSAAYKNITRASCYRRRPLPHSTTTTSATLHQGTNHG